MTACTFLITVILGDMEPVGNGNTVVYFSGKAARSVSLIVCKVLGPGCSWRRSRSP